MHLLGTQSHIKTSRGRHILFYLTHFTLCPSQCLYVRRCSDIFLVQRKDFLLPNSMYVIILLYKVFYTVPQHWHTVSTTWLFCVFLHNGWYHRAVQFICQLEIILMLKDAICRIIIIKNLNKTILIMFPTYRNFQSYSYHLYQYSIRIIKRWNKFI